MVTVGSSAAAAHHAVGLRMLFSIVTPTRNSLHDLKRCVGSVRAQSPVAYEHLPQDAVSADGTPEWLAEQSDLKAVSQADAGMYDAINRGWARSKGDVLSWLNSDEQYLPGTLDKVRKLFSLHPDVDVVWGDAIVVLSNGDPVSARREIPLRKRYIVNSCLNAMSCTMFFRRRLLEKGLLIFDRDFRSAGDMDLILRLLEAGVGFLHTREYLSLFGLSGSNLSLQSGSEREVQEIRRRHGGARSAALRHFLVAGRRVERLLRGCYAHRDVSYRFAIDEIPHYRDVFAPDIGGRYSASSIAPAT
jgi:glycosyltransferase involved in cell wall biosynthesis